jgi:trk system potassium uptake protein TrkA
MRVVFIGAGELTRSTAQMLLRRGHDAIIIEQDKARIEELSADLAAGFIHGDGSKPAILREANPAASDFLFCLTGDDRTNILASLLGRSLEYRRVVTRIADASYEHICIELGLTDIIVPNFTIARYLVDMSEGQDPLQVTGLIKGEARIFSFVAGREDEGKLAGLKLPDASRVMFLYRQEKFILPDDDTNLQRDDEVIIIAHSKALPYLEARWGARREQPGPENNLT